jgi:hypothetical protein
MIVDDHDPGPAWRVRAHICSFLELGASRNVQVTTVPPVVPRSTSNEAPIDVAR